MKRKILWISMCLPLKNAFHAGGKTFNYYFELFAQDKNNEITLISKVLPNEEQYLKTINQNICAIFVQTPKNKLKKGISYVKSLNSKFNPLYKYGNFLTKEIYDQIEKKLKGLKMDGYLPDIVILEWTSMVLFIDKVKKCFPKAKYIASEHDVSFLGLERKVINEKNYMKKFYKKVGYINEKKRELRAIEKCDLVVTYNQKDKILLVQNGISTKKIGVIVPYYHQLENTKHSKKAKNILFFGAMNRIENYSSVIWFIDNVLPLLYDCDIRFVVLGNSPPKKILKKQNERVLVTGFVEDIQPYFASSICLVAPLLSGAGIKVKVIEALSAGIPVLTNDIGIEGINAINKVHYIHCVSAKDYEQAIREIILGKINVSELSINARQLIKKEFDLSKSFVEYRQKIYGLIK